MKEEADGDSQIAAVEERGSRGLSTAAQEFVATSFTDFMSRVVIEPFGSRLFQPIYDLAQELDLDESLFTVLKQKAEGQRRN